MKYLQGSGFTEHMAGNVEDRSAFSSNWDQIFGKHRLEKALEGEKPTEPPKSGDLIDRGALLYRLGQEHHVKTEAYRLALEADDTETADENDRIAHGIQIAIDLVKAL